MGMGYTVPYTLGGSFTQVNTNKNEMMSLDGRIYYCPGTKVSFSRHTFNLRMPWYDFWRGVGNAVPSTDGTNTLDNYGMGVPQSLNTGNSVPSTYFYRNGMYDKNKGLADSDPSWASTANWNINATVRPDDPIVSNKPYLTCFWRGYNSATGNTDYPVAENAPHDGVLTNCLTTNGSAYTYKPGMNSNGKRILPVWAWFDYAAFSAAQYDSEGNNGVSFYNQLPWFWVLAERRQ